MRFIDSGNNENAYDKDFFELSDAKNSQKKEFDCGSSHFSLKSASTMKIKRMIKLHQDKMDKDNDDSTPLPKELKK